MRYLRKLTGIAVITVFVFPLFAFGDAVLAQTKRKKSSYLTRRVS